MSDHIDQLAKLIDDRQLMLFAGSGLSATIGLPDWKGLISTMSKELGYDSDLFLSLGDFPSLAEFYLLNGGSKAKLAKWMKKNWHSDSIDIGKSEIHKTILELNFPIIYTTNYEHWLERSHKFWKRPYTKISNGLDITKITKERTQIVKFHGDVNSPTSMVVSESDYFERLRFESELDIKLRSDIQRYATIFVGYSLSDINLRTILYRLSKLRMRYSSKKSAPDNFILTNRINNVQDRVLTSWGVLPVYIPDLDRTSGLKNYLTKIKSATSSFR